MIFLFSHGRDVLGQRLCSIAVIVSVLTVKLDSVGLIGVKRFIVISSTNIKMTSGNTVERHNQTRSVLLLIQSGDRG